MEINNNTATGDIKMKLDGKSALIGLIIGILVTCCVAATSSNQKGKYEIAAADGGRVLRIDTQTGEIKRGRVKDCLPFK